MPPPILIPSVKPEIINLTDDDDEIKTKKPSKTFFEKSFSQHLTSTPPVPILSQKNNSSRTPIVLDLTDDDDDDDFIQSTSSYFSQSGKKLKST